MGKVATIGKEFAGNAKPWGEAFDRNSFARPSTMNEATARIRKNFHYFKINYILAMTIVLLITMFIYPKSLLVLSVVLFGWIYLYVIRQKPIVINGIPIEGNVKLTSCSAISMLVIFFLTNVGGLLLYAFTFGVIVIAIHGALRVPDDLFIDETEMSGGFFSLPTSNLVATSV